MVANLGYLAQAQVLHQDRPPIGNDMYGAFGRDFATSDGRRVMVVAISLKQWQALAHATEIEPHLPAIETALDLDLTSEGDRFAGRDALAALIAPWVNRRTLAEVANVFDQHGVCWGPYQTFGQLLEDDWRCSETNPLFRDIDQPGIGKVRTPGATADYRFLERAEPAPAPLLGQHTDEILAVELGLSDREIGRLHDEGVIAGPSTPPR
jgi:2-methylfumaryl-CoA isomerase